MSAINPEALDPQELQMIAEKVKELLIDYGPAIVVRYMLDEIRTKRRVPKEDECELVNHLQKGNINEAAKIIEKYDDNGELKRKLRNLCQDLDNCDISQTELGRYEC